VGAAADAFAIGDVHGDGSSSISGHVLLRQDELYELVEDRWGAVPTTVAVAVAIPSSISIPVAVTAVAASSIILAIARAAVVAAAIETFKHQIL